MALVNTRVRFNRNRCTWFNLSFLEKWNFLVDLVLLLIHFRSIYYHNYDNIIKIIIIFSIDNTTRYILNYLNDRKIVYYYTLIINIILTVAVISYIAKLVFE